jgi:hypothetical protein
MTCAKECVEVDVLIKEEYTCELCNNKYKTSMKAEECEAKHKENDDKVYKDYLVRLNFEELDKAAKHPSQKKLGGE